MKVVFSYDWLLGMRGGEKCLESVLGLFPSSSIHTLFYKKGSTTPFIEQRPIHASFLQHLPCPDRMYRHYLPLYPLAQFFNRPGACDLVISLSHCAAKGIRIPFGAKHLCYCHTPMRYAWLFFDEYFGSYPSWAKFFIRQFLGALRVWDKGTNRRVTHFIANSENTRKRIRAFYGREADVVYPPVDTAFYTPSNEGREDFYLVVSALVPYKRVELAVSALGGMGLKLLVVGTGPQQGALERSAGESVRFLGWRSNEEIRELYRKCRALIFPGEEDFGIVPVEAQACGAPVIAYGRGGALETVVEGQTGIFFLEQTVDGLKEALVKSRGITWDHRAIRRHAERFGGERFQREIRGIVDRIMAS